jgi:hypothetical protein
VNTGTDKEVKVEGLDGLAEKDVIGAVIGSATRSVEKPDKGDEVEKEEKKEVKVETKEPEIEKPEKEAPPEIDFKVEYEKLQKELQSLKTPAKVEVPEKKEPKLEAPKWTPKGRVKAEDVDKIYAGGEEAVNYLNQLLDQTREDMAQLFLSYVDKEMAPIRQEREIKERAYHEEAFLKKYEGLKPYAPVVSKVADSLALEIKEGRVHLNSWEEVYAEVAKRTNELLELTNKASGRSATPPPPSSSSAKTPIKKDTKVDPDSDEAAIQAVMKASQY